MIKRWAFAVVAALLLISCSRKEEGFTVYFDGSKEMSGAKFALADINPDLPLDWDGYNFVVLEYKITTAQRFQLGFTTDWGYNELRVMSYVPNAWNRIAIPMKYFTDLPDPAVDLAATFNHARYTGWINLGGKRGPMHGVDSIGFRIRRAIGTPSLTVRNVTLAVDDPGDLYMEDTPAFDEFGQSVNVDYPEKVSSLAELEKQWREEEAGDFSTAPYNYSKFGGYRDRQVNGTGYFRVECIDGRWWFIDPEGYLFLSVGVDCINYGNGGSIRAYDKRRNMYKELPSDEVMAKLYAGNPGGRQSQVSIGMWNLYRRYGDGFENAAKEMTLKRMDKWGVNTIANWSNLKIAEDGGKAFLTSLSRIGQDSELMGYCDVFAPDYKSKMEASIKNMTARYAGNPWLVGYFIGNEPAWINEEARLCELILDGKDRPIKTALRNHLKTNGDTDKTRRDFIIRNFEVFLKDVQAALRKYDANHLNLGFRFGDPHGLKDDVLSICGKYFDVFSFNCYSLKPDPATMDRVLECAGLPMIIGEYHFGTVDRGLAQSLWQVESEEQRGVAYRYYTEQGYSHPGLIGTGYFQWADQDFSGRFDGENYNCGLIDVTDRPYKEQVGAMMETAKVLYKVHSGQMNPYDVVPRNARGHGSVPDLWNE